MRKENYLALYWRQTQERVNGRIAKLSESLIYTLATWQWRAETGMCKHKILPNCGAGWGGMGRTSEAA